MRKHWWIGGLGLAVLAGGAAVLAMQAKGEAPAKDAKKDEKPALEFQAREVVRPSSAAMPGVIEFSGPLVAPNTVVVRAKANGSLVALAVGEGSRVKAGQSLGQLDLEELRHRVAERHAGLEAARAQYEQADRQYKANQGLAAQNFIASTALDNSRASLENARGQMLSAQAQLGTSEVLLRQAALVSPINGVISKRHAVPGEKLAAEQQVLTIVDLSRLELAGLVGTHEVGRLQPGMTVQLRVEGVDEPVPARIARIAPAAEPGTRSIGVTLSLDNPGERLRAGRLQNGAGVFEDVLDRCADLVGVPPLTAFDHEADVVEVPTDLFVDVFGDGRLKFPNLAFEATQLAGDGLRQHVDGRAGLRAILATVA